MRRIHELGRNFLETGLIPIPLCKNSKQISYRAMGLRPYHAFAARKRFKDVAFQSMAFHLALQPPCLDDIDRWLANHDGNLGIVAGFGGLIILDFDDKASFHKWSAANPHLADTPVEETKCGYHVYLRCQRPIGCSTLYMGKSKVGHIKGFGGYVACAPSRLGGSQVYHWLDGRSPLQVKPALISGLDAIGLEARSPLRRAYERLFSRGTYDPHEALTLAELGDA